MSAGGGGVVHEAQAEHRLEHHAVAPAVQGLAPVPAVDLRVRSEPRPRYASPPPPHTEKHEKQARSKMTRRPARALPGRLASRATEQSSAMGSASAQAASLAAGAAEATTGCAREPEAPPGAPPGMPGDSAVNDSLQAVSTACDSPGWKR